MGDGTVVHDEYIEVKYEFTTTEGSHRFQGDLRGQDLVDHFDVDVVWSDRDGRTDSFGSVRGIGAIQRLKMWRDRYTTYHYLTFYANRTVRRYREYLVLAFDAEIRNRDDSHRRLRLNAQGRRGSAPEGSSSSTSAGGGSSSSSAGGSGSGSSSRRFTMSSLRHGRGTSSHSSSHGSSRSSRSSHSRSGHDSSSASSTSGASPGSGLDIRYLGIQFSRNEGKEDKNQKQNKKKHRRQLLPCFARLVSCPALPPRQGRRAAFAWRGVCSAPADFASQTSGGSSSSG